MDNEEIKPELTTEQKIQRVATGILDVTVLVQAALIAKKLVTTGLTKFRN